MEKQAVVREGKTPSEVSGKPSTMIKNGKALAPGEKDETAASEERLAKQMAGGYNTARKP